eukprot:scaffold2063_cov401-Prasinococcus_capsulatus_cf.AAC.18
MSEFAEVYLITQCMSDRAEQRVREALQAAGIEHAASTTQLGLCRLLFCETTMGAASVRLSRPSQLSCPDSRSHVVDFELRPDDTTNRTAAAHRHLEATGTHCALLQSPRAQTVAQVVVIGCDRVLYAGCEEISFSTQIEKIAGLEELQVEPARDEAASG